MAQDVREMEEQLEKKQNLQHDVGKEIQDFINQKLSMLQGVQLAPPQEQPAKEQQQMSPQQKKPKEKKKEEKKTEEKKSED